MPYIRTKFSVKNLLKNKEMDFENGVKNIQALAYNGARTVIIIMGPVLYIYKVVH